jgi:hypothetical protein
MEEEQSKYVNIGIGSLVGIGVVFAPTYALPMVFGSLISKAGFYLGKKYGKLKNNIRARKAGKNRVTYEIEKNNDLDKIILTSDNYNSFNSSIALVNDNTASEVITLDNCPVMKVIKDWDDDYVCNNETIKEFLTNKKFKDKELILNNLSNILTHYESNSNIKKDEDENYVWKKGVRKHYYFKDDNPIFFDPVKNHSKYDSVKLLKPDKSLFVTIKNDEENGLINNLLSGYEKLIVSDFDNNIEIVENGEDLNLIGMRVMLSPEKRRIYNIKIKNQ